MRKHIVQTKLHEITAIPLEVTMIELSDVYHLVHISMAGGFDATNLTSVNWKGASISLHPRLSCHSLHTHTYTHTHTHHRHTQTTTSLPSWGQESSTLHTPEHTHTKGPKHSFLQSKWFVTYHLLKILKDWWALVIPNQYAVGNLLWMQLILPFFKNKIIHTRWHMTNLSYQFLVPFKITVQPDHSHVMGVTPIMPSG